MSDADLSLLTKTSDGVAVVHVSGDFDLSTVPAFNAEVEHSLAAALLVVDLARCTFLDSSALRALVRAQRRSAANGGRLVLVAPTPPARRVLEMATLDRFVPVSETLEEAVNSVA